MVSYKPPLYKGAKNAEEKAAAAQKQQYASEEVVTKMQQRIEAEEKAGVVKTEAQKTLETKEKEKATALHDYHKQFTKQTSAKATLEAAKSDRAAARAQWITASRKEDLMESKKAMEIEKRGKPTSKTEAALKKAGEDKKSAKAAKAAAKAAERQAQQDYNDTISEHDQA